MEMQIRMVSLSVLSPYAIVIFQPFSDIYEILFITGPMYHNGIYHLFYQYNPYSATWGNITWGHSVSDDLVNWIHLEHALVGTEPYDINGCCSGSTTFLTPEKPVILYTGGNYKNRQTQNLAWPKNLSDPFLSEWEKAPQNPLMNPIDDIDPKYFRDPTTAWKGPDGKWRVLVGNQMNDHGQALLYTSTDFVRWTRSKNPLHSSNKTTMWDCPDFYPVSINGNSKKRRILWAWIPESDADSDDLKKGWSGLQSVPRSILLSKNHRQLIQWPIKEIEKLRGEEGCNGQQMKCKCIRNESRKIGCRVAKGLQSCKEAAELPKDASCSQSGCYLFQISNERLLMRKVELKSYASLHFMCSALHLLPLDVKISFDLPSLKEAELMGPSWADPQLLCSQKAASVRGKVGPFGLLVLASKGLKEKTAVFFRVFRSSHDKYVVLMCSDQSRSSLREGLDITTYGAFMDIDPSQEKISLRTLIDHSIIESFGGKGRSCITARVYPKLAIGNEAELYAFSNGTLDVTISRLKAWSMKKAHLVSSNDIRSHQVSLMRSQQFNLKQK
ncbi:hypothetical protein SLEP1_g15895 [Rubroshorea leprosula]|uniref:Uncharacterized protein n=1 Tax=Rubroshorea leprosula TaxID=152421 RepID=A0AAV5IP11_9ROSI|nr:hypothetical protein SLEP1_g15895 [Rubroshorea leprosula]